MANDEPRPDVLSSLPRTRPQRRSPKRDAAASAGVKAASKSAKAKPKPASANGKPKAAAKSKPKAGAKARRQAPARAIPPAGFAVPADTETRPAPGGVELIGTAVQAAGELAQIGLAIGGQAVKSALGRIGRP